MDFFNLLGSDLDSASINCLAALRRSRESNRELHLLHGCLPLPLHFELDLPSLHGERLPASLGCIPLWGPADSPLR